MPAALYTYEGAAAPSTALRSQNPVLLLFAHIEKTGGTSVRAWLQERAHAGDIDLFVPYPLARCYVYNRFPAITGAQTAERKSCGKSFMRQMDTRGGRHGCIVSGGRNSSVVNWRRSRIAIEFHAESLPTFASRLLPNLKALRARYAEFGGVALTMLLWREPVHHLVSSYRMWPPCMQSPRGSLDNSSADGSGPGANVAVAGPSAWCTPAPLPDFAEAAVGAQAGRLVMQPHSFTQTLTHFGRQNGMMLSDPRGCHAVARPARAAVGAFDVVAPTECMQAALATVAVRMGFNRSEDASSSLKPPHLAPTATASLPRWRGTFSELNATSRARVRAAARCDRTLYNLVVRRARAELHGGCDAAARLRAIERTESARRVFARRADSAHTKSRAPQHRLVGSTSTTSAASSAATSAYSEARQHGGEAELRRPPHPGEPVDPGGSILRSALYLLRQHLCSLGHIRFATSQPLGTLGWQSGCVHA